MKIIGITGGIGSGKTTVGKMFESFGAEVIDADKISREVTKKDGAAYAEIVSFFGNEILLPNKELNRKAISDIVFKDKKSLEMLNKITHKHIFLKMEERMKNSEKEVVVLDVPLLFSSDFPFECDLTVGVIADREERIKRVMARDGLKREDVIRRIENQISDEELKSKADVIIYNNSQKDALKKVEDILKIRNE